MKVFQASGLIRLAAFGATFFGAAALPSSPAHAGTLVPAFGGVNGIMEFSSGYQTSPNVCVPGGGPPPMAIPANSFSGSGGSIRFGSGGCNGGSAVYGTITYSAGWIPAPGKTIQEDPPPLTYNMTVNVSAGAMTASGVSHGEGYVALFDGFPSDIANIPAYPGNPIDPWYYTFIGGGQENTLWNWVPQTSGGENPAYTPHVFNNIRFGTAITLDFDAANPADADNNPASWDTNPSRHPGAAWPCYAQGNNGEGESSSYSIQVAVSL
jgi:hypothetical protein